MPSLQDLPIEVLHKIEVSQHDLSSLVRTNWFFYDTFLPMMYEYFIWGDEDRDDGEARADHELSDLFTFIKTIAENPCLASHVTSVNLADWNFGEDETGHVTVNQSNALVQFSGGKPGSSIHRVKTLVQGDVIEFLLANLPRLTDLSLHYPAPGETILDVPFPKLQRLRVAPQLTDWCNGFRNIDIATVVHFLRLATLISFEAHALSFEKPASFMAIPPCSSRLLKLDLSGEDIPLQYLKHFLRLPKTLRVFRWTRERSTDRHNEDFWPTDLSFPAASATEIQDALSSVKESIEELNLSLIRVHGSSSYDHGVLSFKGFMNLKVLEIASEFMLSEKQCGRGSILCKENADDEESWLADGLPASLNTLILCTEKVPRRDLKFWPRQLTRIVSIRTSLPSLKSIAIIPSYAEVDCYSCRHDPTLNQNAIFSQVEDKCEAHGIKLTGPWQDYTPWLDKQLSRNVPAKQLTGIYNTAKAAMEGGYCHTERFILRTESDVLTYRTGNARLAEYGAEMKDMIKIIRAIDGFF